LNTYVPVTPNDWRETLDGKPVVDAMASLAEMITKGYAVPTREGETPLELLKRAAKLGHVGAARALEQEQQGASGLEQQRNFQEERYRRMHDFFRGIIPVVPPRFSN
jgi:hypothetical protein